MNHRHHKLLRFLRGEAPEVIGSEDFFDRLCVYLKTAIDSEQSNLRICKIFAAEWLFSEAYDVDTDDIDEVVDAINDAEVSEDDEIVFVDTKTLEDITDIKGFKLVGRVTDQFFDHASLCLWKRDKQIALSSAI